MLGLCRDGSTDVKISETEISNPVMRRFEKMVCDRSGFLSSFDNVQFPSLGITKDLTRCFQTGPIGRCRIGRGFHTFHRFNFPTGLRAFAGGGQCGDKAGREYQHKVGQIGKR